MSVRALWCPSSAILVTGWCGAHPSTATAPLHTHRDSRFGAPKIVARKTEEGKVALRNVRRDTVEKLRGMQKAGTISEDDLRRFQEQVQKVTDGHTEQLDAVEKTKEREILES